MSVRDWLITKYRTPEEAEASIAPREERDRMRERRQEPRLNARLLAIHCASAEPGSALK